MKLSQIAAVLGLDEMDDVRPVPLTDEDLARAGGTAPPPGPTPNRATRRAHDRQKRRMIRGG